jgi:hypothetical protein
MAAIHGLTVHLSALRLYGLAKVLVEAPAELDQLLAAQ